MVSSAPTATTPRVGGRDDATQAQGRLQAARAQDIPAGHMQEAGVKPAVLQVHQTCGFGRGNLFVYRMNLNFERT